MNRTPTRTHSKRRQSLIPLVIAAALTIPTLAPAGDILFVSDSVTDAENIPEVLSGGAIENPHPMIMGAGQRLGAPPFHNVTVVRNDFSVTGGSFGAAEGTNTTLLGDLSGYCAVYWSASGPHEPLGLTAERLGNGSFEDTEGTHTPDSAGDYDRLAQFDTSLPGWNVDELVAWGVDPNDPGNVASEGEGFIDLSGIGNESNGQVSVNLPTTTGVEYKFSIDMRNVSIVSFDGVDTALTDEGAADGGYNRYTVLYTAVDAETTVAIRKDPANTTGIAFIDNVSFRPEPDPNPTPGLGADGGLHADDDVFSNLLTYVENGGYVFVTGHDATAHPFDEKLVEFLAGGGAISEQKVGPGYTPIANIVSALTTGPNGIANQVPTGGGENPVDGVREQDYLLSNDSNTVILTRDASIGGGVPAAGWTVRTPFGDTDDLETAGHIAYVANGVFFYETVQEDDMMMSFNETLSDGEDSSWLTVPAYTGALLNFADNACAPEALPVVEDLHGRGKSGKVNLVWTENGADSYNVYRGDMSGGPYDLIGSATGGIYEDNDVVAGLTYYYIVRGVFGGTESGDSNEAEVLVPERRRR